jgi:hypothetical protein
LPAELNKIISELNLEDIIRRIVVEESGWQKPINAIFPAG